MSVVKTCDRSRLHRLTTENYTARFSTIMGYGLGVSALGSVDPNRNRNNNPNTNPILTPYPNTILTLTLTS